MPATLMCLVLLVVGSGAQAAVLRAVQTGTTSIAATSASVTVPLTPAVDTTRAFLVFGVSESAADPQDGQISGQITSSTQVTFQRANAGVMAITIRWYVAEFSSGVRVQRGSQSIASGGPTWNVGINNFPLAKSFPIISMRATDAAYDDNDFIRAKITTTMNLQLTKTGAATGAGTRVVEWQVVEYTDANVQTGDVTLAAAQASGTNVVPMSPSVNTAKSWLLYTYDSATGTVANIGQKLVRGLVTNGTTVTFDRNNTGQAINLTWYVVEFTDTTMVQHNSTAFTTVQTTVGATLPTAVNPARSIATAGGYTRGGRSPYSANDNPGVGWVTLVQTSWTNLALTRGLTGSVTADVGWFVVTFASGCCDLTTTPSGTTVAVETSESKMVWDSARGGGLNEYYGKVEANSGVSRVGQPTWYNLFSTQVCEGPNPGCIWYGEDTSGSVTPLEVTPVRVRLRQNHDYTATAHLERNWTAAGHPRLAFNEMLRFDDTKDRRGSTGLQPRGDNPCAGNPFYCGSAANSTDKVFIVSDNADTYSDMLAVPYLVPGDPFFARNGAGAWTSGPEPGPPDAWLARVFEAWGTEQPTGPGTFVNHYAFYPGLGALTSAGTEWTPYATDYRTPSNNAPTVGSRWLDPSENTSGTDNFNEAEAAYLFDMDVATGLTFVLNAPSPRIRPFFKIRRWRSVTAVVTATLDGQSMQRNQDFRAAVKPVTRALHCGNSTWPTCTSSPQVLANGGLAGATEFLAEHSAGKNFTLNFSGTQYVYFGSDSRFRGLNVALATAGQMSVAVNLSWQYSTGAGWANLEGAPQVFVDGTNQLTQNGVISWSDPVGWGTAWNPTTVNGGPSLYYVRVSRAAGTYSTQPVEAMIKTDILLVQYCANVTAAQTFAFFPPQATVVTLQTFSAAPLDGAVELSWETASELSNLGFHLYRATGAEGPYERITPSVIPGLGSSPVGQRYSYLDAGLANGVTYHYKLEDIETTGATNLHGPVEATPGAGAPDAEPATGGGGEPGTGAGSSGGGGARVVFGDPAANALRVTREGLRAAVVELVTEGFYAVSQPDGTVRLELPGFEEINLPGAPSVPSRRAWVEAVSGRRVQLGSVRASDVSWYPDLHLAATGAPKMELGPEGTVRAGRRPAGRDGFRGPQLYPAQAARLAGTAFQGELKKALLELSPLRWDGATGHVVLARRLVVRVEFEGEESGEAGLGDSRGRRPRVAPAATARGLVLAQLVTRAPGIYGVRYEDVFESQSRVRAVSSLRLSRLGEAVAFHVEPPTTTYGPGSVLYFVSEGAALNPYGKEALYELSEGTDGLVMEEAKGSPSRLSPNLFHYRATRTWEENRTYQAGLLEAEDLWQWEAVLSRSTRSYPFTLSSLAAGGEAASLTVWLQGGSDFEAAPDHHVRLLVNGFLAGEASWDGMRPQRVEAAVPSGVLREGPNQLQVENVGDTEAAHSVVYLDKFGLGYPRLLVGEGGQLRGSFGEGGVASVSGLGSGAVVVETSEGPPRWVRGVAPLRGGVSFLAAGEGSYWVSEVLGAEVRRPRPPRLKLASNRAEYLVLGPEALLGEAQALLERRASRGLAVKAVAIEDVWDEFGHGEPRPEAVREFLSYAYHRWRAPSLRYVLLLGDATFDFKDNLKTGQVNQVPPLMVETTYLWTASDPLLAAVNGDDALPDLAIGRLPARTAEEARVLIGKVLAFEDARVGFRGNAVLVADNADPGGEFEANSDAVGALLGAERPVEKIYLRDLGRPAMRPAIRDAFNRGSSLMSYVGHGAVAIWASENVFNVMDVRNLSPQVQQPFVMAMNCLNGYFHMPGLNALGEELVKVEGRGAIAAFAPSGLSMDGPAHIYQRALVTALATGRHRRLGDAILAAQAAYTDTGAFPELLIIFHLLGDPGLELR